MAVCQAPSTRRGPAVVLSPDQVKEISLGKPGFQRRALMMVTEEVAADYLFIGEAIVPPANWARNVRLNMSFLLTGIIPKQTQSLQWLHHKRCGK